VEDSIGKRIFLGFVVLITAIAAFDVPLLVFHLDTKLSSSAASVYSLVAFSLAVLMAVLSFINARLRRTVAGAGLILYGLALGILPLADFISHLISGRSVLDWWDKYTVISQLLLIFVVLGVGSAIVYYGVSQLKQARES
jgi:hypothetical protein